MRILVSGSSGFIGSALTAFLADGGHRITRLVRPGSRVAGGVRWNPAAGLVDTTQLQGEGIEGVVHLAGASIVGGKWTHEKKAAIRDSRVNGTRLLSEALARLAKPPKAMVCASAIGYYGSRGDELLTEDSASGDGFLAEVCREWEAATQPAVQRGIRVVNLRIGVVLSPFGGALKLMLPAFRMGLGGPLGSGRHYMSWIALDDVVGVILHALTTEALRGPVNTVSPAPVTNREFTKTLGQVLRRPTLCPVPAVALRFAFGALADEVLLGSTRVVPAKLTVTSYTFHYPTLEGTLRHLLEKQVSPRPSARNVQSGVLQ